MFVDALVALSGPTYRFSRGMRPFMLVFRLRNLRKVFAACLSTMKRAAIIFFLVVFLILLFGFVGHALMGSVVPDGDLSSVTTAFYRLLLLQTTMGVFSSQTQPYYKASRWTALYFVVYSIVGNLLVLKMIIAVGYDSYRTYMKAKISKHLSMRDRALETAFRLLDSGCGVSFPHWQHMCKALGRPDDLVMLCAGNAFPTVCTRTRSVFWLFCPTDCPCFVPHRAVRKRRSSDTERVCGAVLEN
jgi:Ion transport protein